MRWDVRILWPTSAIRYIEALGLVEKKMATHEGRGGMVDRLKNKNGILYDKRPRIPSSSNVFSVDFSLFFFFFPSLYLVVAYFLVFSLLFFFFLYFPRSILSPISRWSFSFLVSLMFRNPFFFPRSHSPSWHPRVGGAREGREGSTDPKGGSSDIASSGQMTIAIPF